MQNRKWESKIVGHFDNYSSTYADGYDGEHIFGYSFRTRQSIVTSLLSEMRAEQLLDVGCGPAGYAELCTEKGFIYTGIDLSPQMIAEGHKRWRKLAATSFVIGRPDAREIRRQLILMERVQ